MSRISIGSYFRDIATLRQVTGSRRENVLSEAFKDLLKANARSRDLVFAAQHEFITAQGTRVYPDGAVLHSLRVPLGWYEAKDEDDDLDQEIEKKKRKGYPQDNIIFEDGAQAVLIQNRQEIFRARLSEDDTETFQKLIDRFFACERPEIAQFRKAVEQFKIDLPQVLNALRDLIETASKANAAFRAAEARFLAHAKDTINPAVTGDDVREMLIQHILTEEIFSHVFDDGQFHRENNVAKELYALEDKLLSRDQKRALIGQLGS